VDKDRDKQNLICLDDVKMYGNSPKRLLNKIIINNEIRIIKFDRGYFTKIINSLNKNLTIMFRIDRDRD